jgi:TPR repeat protein
MIEASGIGKMRKILITLLIGLMLTVSGEIVRAGPLEDGIAAYRSGDYATALRILRPLAEQGNAAAQLNLGSMYAHGQGVKLQELRLRRGADHMPLSINGVGVLIAVYGTKHGRKVATAGALENSQNSP